MIFSDLAATNQGSHKAFPALGRYPAASTGKSGVDNERRNAILRHLALSTLLLIFGAGAVNAQQDLVQHKIEVPGASFALVLFMSKTQAAAAIGLPEQESSLTAGPTGDWLAFATEREIARIFGGAEHVIHAFRVERRESDPASAVHVYVVSKDARGASN